MTQIFQTTEKKYPDDFSTRKYAVDKEVQAWRDLQAYQAPDVPEEVLTQIFQTAERKYPDDFSTRKYVVDKEVQAWCNLQNWK